MPDRTAAPSTGYMSNNGHLIRLLKAPGMIPGVFFQKKASKTMVYAHAEFDE
jgi:hypothetical protein